MHEKELPRIAKLVLEVSRKKTLTQLHASIGVTLRCGRWQRVIPHSNGERLTSDSGHKDVGQEVESDSRCV